MLEEMTMLLIVLALLVAPGLGSVPGKYPMSILQVKFNEFGYDYMLPNIYEWSGAPGRFGGVHAFDKGVLTRSCYKSGKDEFCLTELGRFLFNRVESTYHTRDCGVLSCNIEIKQTRAQGNPLKISQVNSFNVSSFMETTLYNVTEKACWDIRMKFDFYWNTNYYTLLGRMYFLSWNALEFYPNGALIPTKVKYYDFHFPITLNDGRCDSIYGIFPGATKN
ncbi:hypothetical protein DSO57_1033042 [Entomophthora muscae]|uniref:Uncharacterized protein n=1 Tax=Entomophthora muscae TaxID=34485 RepID=A0ACC2S2E2_9FUNG|nr:hypothetical protein DSO57_1033042 [Entomophthora muscae]